MADSNSGNTIEKTSRMSKKDRKLYRQRLTASARQTRPVKKFGLEDLDTLVLSMVFEKIGWDEQTIFACYNTSKTLRARIVSLRTPLIESYEYRSVRTSLYPIDVVTLLQRGRYLSASLELHRAKENVAGTLTDHGAGLAMAFRHPGLARMILMGVEYGYVGGWGIRSDYLRLNEIFDRCVAPVLAKGGHLSSRELRIMAMLRRCCKGVKMTSGIPGGKRSWGPGRQSTYAELQDEAANAEASGAEGTSGAPGEVTMETKPTMKPTTTMAMFGQTVLVNIFEALGADEQSIFNCYNTCKLWRNTLSSMRHPLIRLYEDPGLIMFLGEEGLFHRVACEATRANHLSASLLLHRCFKVPITEVGIAQAAVSVCADINHLGLTRMVVQTVRRFPDSFRNWNMMVQDLREIKSEAEPIEPHLEIRGLYRKTMQRSLFVMDELRMRPSVIPPRKVVDGTGGYLYAIRDAIFNNFGAKAVGAERRYGPQKYVPRRYGPHAGYEYDSDDDFYRYPESSEGDGTDGSDDYSEPGSDDDDGRPDAWW